MESLVLFGRKLKVFIFLISFYLLKLAVNPPPAIKIINHRKLQVNQDLPFKEATSWLPILPYISTGSQISRTVAKFTIYRPVFRLTLVFVAMFGSEPTAAVKLSDTILEPPTKVAENFCFSWVRHFSDISCIG